MTGLGIGLGIEIGIETETGLELASLHRWWWCAAVRAEPLCGRVAESRVVVIADVAAGRMVPEGAAVALGALVARQHGRITYLADLRTNGRAAGLNQSLQILSNGYMRHGASKLQREGRECSPPWRIGMCARG